MLPNTIGGSDYDSEEDNKIESNRNEYGNEKNIIEEEEEEEKIDDVMEENRRLKEYLSKL
jgi:hypothetical protein